MTPLRRRIHRLAWISLVMVYLVITAGSIVRATGSGMGCPDWPRCYGYTIPPTSAERVTWSPQRAFKPGQMIIHVWDDGESLPRERLLVAQEAFTTGASFDPVHWAPYERHDYAVFNVQHTWIEFINRLLGAASGIPILLLFGFALVAWRREGGWTTALWSAGALFILGFVAWLGKLVVDGNLIPGSITIHMFGASSLVMCLVLLLRQHDGPQPTPWAGLLRGLLIAAFVGALLQVFVGTQVREEIDYLLKGGNTQRETWIASLTWLFELHRSFSWFLLALNAAWMVLLWRGGLRWPELWAAAGLLLLQVVVGVVLAEFAVPAVLQPVHLVGALLLVGVLWSAVLKARRLQGVAGESG